MWQSIHWICLICNTTQKRTGRETFVRKSVLKAADANGASKKCETTKCFFNHTLHLPCLQLHLRLLASISSLFHLYYTSIYTNVESEELRRFCDAFRLFYVYTRLPFLAMSWSNGDRNSVEKWDHAWKIAGQLHYWTPQAISLPYDFSIGISIFLIKRLMRQANHLSSQRVRSRSALLECLDHIIACWILHLVCILFLNLPVRSNNMGHGHTNLFFSSRILYTALCCQWEKKKGKTPKAL